MKIPMSSPDLTDAEREAVATVLRTPNLSMGGEILAFETAFQEFTGSRHAIGVSSGTAGLHLCVRAAGIQDGDLVITTPFSFVASANVLLFERAVPVFVDVDPLTGNIDPDLVHRAARDLLRRDGAAKRWLPRRTSRTISLARSARVEKASPWPVWRLIKGRRPIVKVPQTRSAFYVMREAPVCPRPVSDLQ